MTDCAWRWAPDDRSATWGGGLAHAGCGTSRIAVTGIPFRAGTGRPDLDAEQLLALLIHHGVAGLDQLEGLFAFVLWNEEAQRITVGRDPFGLKTLYWSEDADGLAFSPRIMPLAPPGRRRLNVSAAIDFLVNGFTDQDDATLLVGVHQLPPGCVIELDLDGWRPGAALAAVRPWYTPPAADSLDLDAREAAHHLRARLADAARRAAGDPRTALLLSGGLDSSAIAAFTTAPTYKAYFGIPAHDQADVVADVVAQAGVSHAGAAVRPGDLLRHRDALLDALEVPYERSILAAHWAVCRRMAIDGVRVTLDGVGADELLGGYLPWLRVFGALSRGEHVRGLPYVSTSHPTECFATADVPAEHLAWLAPDIRGAGARRMRDDSYPPIRSFGELCRHHLRHGALPMLLRYNREIGSAFGQEARSPFLDRGVVELSVGLGGRHKVVMGQSKYLLREAVRGLVPDRVLAPTEKLSYSSVEVAWLRQRSLGQLRDEVARTAAEWPGLLDATALRDAATTVDPGKTEVLRLWRISCFGAWARRFGVIA